MKKRLSQKQMLKHACNILQIIMNEGGQSNIVVNQTDLEEVQLRLPADESLYGEAISMIDEYCCKHDIGYAINPVARLAPSPRAGYASLTVAILNNEEEQPKKPEPKF